MVAWPVPWVVWAVLFSQTMLGVIVTVKEYTLYLVEEQWALQNFPPWQTHVSDGLARQANIIVVLLDPFLD